GALVFVAVILHKVPEGLAISSLFLAAGQGRRRAILAAAALGAATIAGVALTDQVSALREHGLALAAGVTLYVGMSNLVPEFRARIERGNVSSMVFWGPPGTGKTTLARLIARYTDREFVAFSAVTEGVPRVREIVREAEDRLATGRGTILFADEIHRFNKAQQDAFLPHAEAGTITLIGATTENPSFEIIGALLSRVRAFVLPPLSPADGAGLVRT